MDNSDDEYPEEDDFYNHYEPYEEDFDDDEHQPFVPEEEKIHPLFTFKTIKAVKPIFLNSPTKSEENSPKKTDTKSPSWWSKKVIDESNRIVNGVLNYAALLPPLTPKPKVVEVIPQPQKKKI